MLKIGILTEYYNSTNYGGVLQAFALEKKLQMLGYSVEQICYKKDNDISLDRKIVLIKLLRSGKIITAIKRIVLFVFNRLTRYWIKHMNNILDVTTKSNSRSNAFINFRENMILHTETVYNSETIYKCSDYDCYITGSDEVWRISSEKLNPAYWLTFVNSSKRKVSYAASLSMDCIPESMHNVVKNALSDYNAISVRQNSDKKILEELIDESIEWVLDPTLLLSSHDWNSVASKNPFNQINYIFTYFLGNSKMHRNCAMNFAKEHNLKIINIPYMFGEYRSCDRNFGDYQISEVSPELWISLIRDAKFVFTDSFHGMVFSILFHKPFYIFLRDKNSSEGSRNSRIFSLLKLFKLDNRLINNRTRVSSVNDIDYNIVDEILEIERKKSLAFLKKAIEG